MAISKAMRQIGWVHINVHKLNWALEALLKEEEDHRWNRNPRPQPQTFSKWVCLTRIS